LDLGAFGFSSIEVTFPAASKLATPYRSGSVTWWMKIVAPSGVASARFMIAGRSCPKYRLSPRISADGLPARNSSAISSACAMPSGLGCRANVSVRPQAAAPENSFSNSGRSCGVAIIRISRMPAAIRVASG
jgi:hypothetical protein